MSKRKAALLMAALTLAACTDSAQREILGPKPPTRDIVRCTDEGPVPDGCPLEFSDSPEEIPFAITVEATTGLKPLWTGQSLDISAPDYVGECAPYAYIFSVFVNEENAMVQFAPAEVMLKIADLPSTSYFGVSVPRARYRVPQGPIYSVRPLGRYQVSGGDHRRHLPLGPLSHADGG